MLYSFEDFSLDTARRELRHGGALIALTHHAATVYALNTLAALTCLALVGLVRYQPGATELVLDRNCAVESVRSPGVREPGTIPRHSARRGVAGRVRCKEWTTTRFSRW